MKARRHNIEVLVLSRLLRGNAKDQQMFERYPLTSEMFQTYTTHFNFITEFKEKYGKFPTKSTFQRKFKSFNVVRTKEHVEYYCDQLIERENFKRLQTVANNIKPLVDAGRVSEAIAKLRDSLDTAVVSANVKGVDLKKIGKDRYNEAVVERRKAVKAGNIYDTPYPKLNKYLILKSENLITLTARLGVGKSWILLFFALHWMRKGLRVLIISKEMSEEEFVDRVDAIEARLDWSRFQKGTLKRIQRVRFKNTLNNRVNIKGDMKIIGDASIESQSLEQLVGEIDNYAPDVVMIDGVYQFDIKGARDEVQKTIMLSRKMKRIAKARKVLLFQTVQQNRTAEGKKKGGGVAAVAWGDAISQDSDLVLELVAPEGRESDARILKVIKGRNAGYTEVAINFKMKPWVDLTEMFGTSLQRVHGKSHKINKVII